MQLKMLRNAIVTVEKMVEGTAGKKRAIVTITDPSTDQTVEHDFAGTSRVSKALDVMTPEQLSERLSGGSYFLIDGKLHDWRDGNYHGFVHTDESIDKLAEVVGVTTKPTHKAGQQPQVVLGKQWSDNPIVIPEYKEGGQFSSVLSFRWNPFSSNVNSELEIVRQICSNGMVGITPFLNSRIPLINRWEEHLEIANKQIQHKVDDIVTRRLAQMGRERATVADLLLLEDHIRARLQHMATTDIDEQQMLRSLISIVSPTMHLSQYYKDGVFQDRRVAAQVPAHLTTFDAYNITTEVRTHTTENRDSTTFALDKFANALVFDHKDTTNASGKFVQPQSSSFSDADTAFFGGNQANNK